MRVTEGGGFLARLKPQEDKSRAIMARLSSDLYTRVEAVCKEHNVTISDFLREALKAALEQVEEENDGQV